MAGTPEGGRRAAETNKRRYGETFYNQIGYKGGKISRGGGFAVHPELASAAGRKGAIKSAETRRAKAEARREGALREQQDESSTFGEFINRIKRLGERFN